MKRDTGKTLMGFPIYEDDEMSSGELAIGKPLSVNMPICPKCGLVARFMRRSEYVYDMVPIECGCGWHGRAMVTTSPDSEIDVLAERFRVAAREGREAYWRWHELNDAAFAARTASEKAAEMAGAAREALLKACTGADGDEW